jgi:GntR family transcriptional regulator, transcriptional repressor for pyruvate dehydrogenase complex
MTTIIERPAVLSDQLVAHLERRIRSGKIPPGSRLPSERELCAQFGVSRMVVREAIARLKGDGYVETRQGAGASVPAQPGFLSYRLDGSSRIRGQQDLLHIMELRFAVEVVATQLAALRRKDSDLVAMEVSLEEMREAVRKGGDGSRADDEFHYAVAASTQNPHLRRFVEFLRYQFGATRRPGWSARAHKSGESRRMQLQHEQILTLIRNRDADAASRAAAEHLADAAARLGVRANAGLPNVVVQNIDKLGLAALTGSDSR